MRLSVIGKRRGCNLSSRWKRVNAVSPFSVVREAITGNFSGRATGSTLGIRMGCGRYDISPLFYSWESNRTPRPPPRCFGEGGVSCENMGLFNGRVTASPLRCMVGNGRLSESPLQFGIDRHIGAFFCLFFSWESNPTPGPPPPRLRRGGVSCENMGLFNGRVTASPLRCMVGNGRLSESPLFYSRARKPPPPRPPTPIKGEGEKSRVYIRFDVSLGRGMKEKSFAWAAALWSRGGLQFMMNWHIGEFFCLSRGVVARGSTVWNRNQAPLPMPMETNLVSMYSLRPSCPDSRPKPLLLRPPKGASAVAGTMSLTPMMPKSRPS